MHLKCKKKKNFCILEGGTWQGIEAILERFGCFVFSGRESETFCDCFHFVLVWEPSW